MQKSYECTLKSFSEAESNTLLIPQLVYTILTGYLEDENQVTAVWAFFKIQMTQELIQSLYILPRLSQLNLENSEGPEHLLRKALKKDDIWLLRLAILKGLNINGRTNQTRPLNQAIEENATKCLKELLTQPGIDTDNLPKEENDSQFGEKPIDLRTALDSATKVDTALIQAIKVVNIPCIEILLRHGVNLSCTGAFKLNAYYWALRKLKEIDLQSQQFFSTKEWSNIANQPWEGYDEEKSIPNETTSIDGIKQDPCLYLRSLIELLRAPQSQITPISLAVKEVKTPVPHSLSKPPTQPPFATLDPTPTGLYALWQPLKKTIENKKKSQHCCILL